MSVILSFKMSSLTTESAELKHSTVSEKTTAGVATADL